MRRNVIHTERLALSFGAEMSQAHEDHRLEGKWLHAKANSSLRLWARMNVQRTGEYLGSTSFRPKYSKRMLVYTALTSWAAKRRKASCSFRQFYHCSGKEVRRASLPFLVCLALDGVVTTHTYTSRPFSIGIHTGRPHLFLVIGIPPAINNNNHQQRQPQQQTTRQSSSSILQ